ncbi:hypothetical protein [Sphingomonas sp. 1P08PE]|uniref:hypothetical protein n=1 Tax=Sphingomonas sp. 1P08PE TaxID=554122 RepID=UPI00399FF59F
MFAAPVGMTWSSPDRAVVIDASTMAEDKRPNRADAIIVMTLSVVMALGKIVQNRQQEEQRGRRLE